MIRLPQPSMALNAADVPGAKYKMWNTWDVPATSPVDHTLAWTSQVAAKAPDGYLRAVVINCHGFYSQAPGSTKNLGGFGLKLGTGIYRADTSKFGMLAGKVRAIIITACGTARIAIPGAKGDGDGNLFCQEIAKASGAFVFAGTTHQVGAVWLPFGSIDDFEGLIVGYNPRGETVYSREHGRGLVDGLMNGYD